MTDKQRRDRLGPGARHRHPAHGEPQRRRRPLPAADRHDAPALGYAAGRGHPGRDLRPTTTASAALVAAGLQAQVGDRAAALTWSETSARARRLHRDEGRRLALHGAGHRGAGRRRRSSTRSSSASWSALREFGIMMAIGFAPGTALRRWSCGRACGSALVGLVAGAAGHRRALPCPRRTTA